MAQDYKLLALDKGDNFQDAHGNYWVTAQFEGVQTEVKWVVKDPMTVKEGNSYYGEIKTQTSKAGKEYLRFYRETKPDAAQSNFSGFSNTQPAQPTGSAYRGSSKPAYQPRDDDAIRAQWAIGQAVQLTLQRDDHTDYREILKAAQKFYGMVEQVKNGGETPNPKALATSSATPTTSNKSWVVDSRNPDTKYWPSEQQPVPDDEMASLYASIASAEEFPESDLPPGTF